MRIWEVWLNGKLIADYRYKSYAEKKCSKLVRDYHLNSENDVLFIRNTVTDKITEYL